MSRAVFRALASPWAVREYARRKLKILEKSKRLQARGKLVASFPIEALVARDRHSVELLRLPRRLGVSEEAFQAPVDLAEYPVKGRSLEEDLIFSLIFLKAHEAIG